MRVTKTQAVQPKQKKYWVTLSEMMTLSLSSDTQSLKHEPLIPSSQRYQTGLILDCAIFMNSEKKMKGSPPSLHFRSRDSLPASPLFRHVSANLAYYPGTTLVSAMSHLCQLHDCHDLGRQEYYMATWKEANTWTQLSAPAQP